MNASTDRRRLLGAGCALAATGALAACGGFATRGRDGGGDPEALQFLLWASDAELPAFRALADGFRAGGGPRVELQVVPYSEVLTSVDTALRTDSPPDVFRVSYPDVAAYRAADVLAELPDAAALRPSFDAAAWSAVSDDTAAYGLPHHVDTSMVLVDDEAAAAAGLGPLPATAADAWTWDEFTAAARRVQATRPAASAFAVNWQNAGAFRWLNWVDQAGGRLLTPDLGSVAADDPGLAEALRTTRGFFRDGLVPRSAAARSQPASDLFVNRTVAMVFAGDFLLSEVAAAGFGFSATFLPRDVEASADLGGNALVAVRDSPRRDAALDFLRHCGQPEQQAAFCSAASVLPTRTDVDPAALDYATRPDLMARYVEQAGTIREQLVEQVVTPRSTAVNQQLRDRLDEAFLSGDDDTTALRRLTDGVQSVLDA